jgi:hypothetical protein
MENHSTVNNYLSYGINMFTDLFSSPFSKDSVRTFNPFSSAKDAKFDVASNSIQQVLEQQSEHEVSDRAGLDNKSVKHQSSSLIESKITNLMLLINQLDLKKSLSHAWNNIFSTFGRFVNGRSSALDSAFNENAAQVKESLRWESNIAQVVQLMPEAEKIRLIELPPHNLRGLDLEFMHVIFQAIKDTSPDLSKTHLDLLEAKLRLKPMVLDNVETKYLGGGAVNSVYLIEHEGKKLVFKPNSDALPMLTKIKETLFGTAGLSGIPAGDESFLNERAIATTWIGKMSNNNINVETKAAIINGKKGILMEWAFGTQIKIESYQRKPDKIELTEDIKNQFEKILAAKKSKDKITFKASELGFIAEKYGCDKVKAVCMNRDDAANIESWEFIGKVKIDSFKKVDVAIDGALKTHLSKLLLENNGEFNKSDLNFIAQVSYCRNVKAVCINLNDPTNIDSWLFTGEEPAFKQFNPKNPITANGLGDLQIDDWITGQVDRHPYNYRIDDQGNVKGFDNDCAFGKKAAPKGVDVRQQGTVAGVIPNNSSLMLRMPNVATKAQKARVDDLYARRNELRKNLAPYINPEEVEATIDRLKRLKDHFETEALIVDDAEGLLSFEAMKLTDSNSSYWARELLVFDSHQKNWNYLRAHRQ